MAEVLKVLGQAKPAAGVLTDLDVVPAATSVTGSTIVVCNQDTTAATYRISVAIAGAADAVAQYLAFDIVIEGNTTHTWTIGLTLAATDVLRVRSSTGGVSFNAFGVEVT